MYIVISMLVGLHYWLDIKYVVSRLLFGNMAQIQRRMSEVNFKTAAVGEMDVLIFLYNSIADLVREAKNCYIFGVREKEKWAVKAIRCDTKPCMLQGWASKGTQKTCVVWFNFSYSHENIGETFLFLHSELEKIV